MATHPKFELKTAKNGDFYFNLTAKNGQVILSSEMYKSKDGALNGIKSIKENAPAADMGDDAKHPKFDVKTDKAGEFRFNLTAKNGQVIGSSEGYKSKDGMNNGISSVKENAPQAEIEEAA